MSGRFRYATPESAKDRNMMADVQFPTMPEMAVCPSPSANSFSTPNMAAGIMVMLVAKAMTIPVKPNVIWSLYWLRWIKKV